MASSRATIEIHRLRQEAFLIIDLYDRQLNRNPVPKPGRSSSRALKDH